MDSKKMRQGVRRAFREGVRSALNIVERTGNTKVSTVALEHRWNPYRARQREAVRYRWDHSKGGWDYDNPIRYMKDYHPPRRGQPRCEQFRHAFDEGWDSVDGVTPEEALRRIVELRKLGR